MKRNAVAVAVGALFIAPAAQAQIVFGNDTIGTVQFYGKLYPQYGYAKSKDATQPGESVSTLVGASVTNQTIPAGGPITTPGARQAVDVQNSYLGFRGERDLGSALRGFKAFWQIETAINFDDPGCDPGTSCAGFSTRNSFLGLRTSFGTVKLGNMDTIYKEYGDPFAMFGISSGNFVSASNVLSHIGVGRDRSARFHERARNSIQLETPQIAGFTAGFQYSPDEAKGEEKRTLSSSTFMSTRKAPVGANQSLYSYGIKYDSQRFYVSVHQERHNDFFGGSNNVGLTSLRNRDDTGAHSRDTATRLSAEFRYAEQGRVTFDVAQLKYKESLAPTVAPSTVRFDSYKHATWAVGWEQGFGGPWRFATQYVRGTEGTCTLTGGADCSTRGLYGYMLNAGVQYRLDRQTFLYAIASKLVNGPSARYDNWAANDPERGADILQAAIGVSYSF